MASRAKRRASGQAAGPDLWQRGKWWLIGGGVAGAIVILVALTFAFSGTDRAEQAVDVASERAPIELSPDIAAGPEAANQVADVAPGPESTDLAPDVTWETLSGDFRVSQQRGDVLLLYFSFPG